MPGPLISSKRLNLALPCPVDVAVESVTPKGDKRKKIFQTSESMVNILLSYPDKRGLIKKKK